MKKKIVLFYLLLISLAYADFQLAPQIQEINLNRPGTSRMYLKNESNKLKKIKIYSQVPEDQKSKDLYMGDWLVIYPKLVYLKPNSKKTIRMTARPPKNLQDGEYRSNLVFEEVPVQSFDNNEADPEKVGASIEVLYVLVSTVYGTKGKLDYSGEFKDFQLVEDESSNQIFLTSNIINTGNTALTTSYKITYYKGVKELGVEEQETGKIMRENQNLNVIRLEKLTSEATSMKIEYFYKLKRDLTVIRDGEKEEDEFKLGEEIIPITTITKEEFLKKNNLDK